MERERTYSETYHSVYALNKLGDESAVPVVEEAKRLWSREGFKSDQIIEECDRFLKNFSGTKDLSERLFVPIEKPEKIFIGTDEQREFMKKIVEIPLESSMEDVKKILGKPTEEQPDQFYYNIEEGSEGGYYVSAYIFFDKQKASKIKVRNGDIIRTIIDE